ncbi:MAG TPA: alpha/beta fold hydrolase [Myxococcota bacterium]|nr:alpha/beta fold hydrolase [Myxococcota bacterium]
MLNPAIHERKVQANGLRFQVLEAGAGDRLALCLHGFPELAFSWRNQIPVLADLGWRVWAPDLRGYGGSDRPTGRESYALERLMDDVAGLIDAAAPRETLLIAHDWGGIVAWLFAMRRIRPLSRLVVMNLPHPACYEEALRRGGRQWLRSWYVLFFQLPWLPEALFGARGAEPIGRAFYNMAVHKENFPDEVLEVYRRAAREPGALTAMINYYRAAFSGGGARRQRNLGYPKIDVPTLVIWGEKDSALGVETLEGTSEYVSNLTVHRLPNASHWVQQDAPEEVNALLREWLGL